MVSPRDPVTEDYAGTNIPYRGTEYHGVEPTEDPLNPPTHDETAINVGTPPEQDEPIPVRVVETPSKKEIRDWRGAVFPILGTRLIANRMDTRKTLQITNDGPDDLFLSPDAMPPAHCPVKLIAGGTFKMEATTEVYGTVNSGSEAIARIAWEYIVRA